MFSETEEAIGERGPAKNIDRPLSAEEKALLKANPGLTPALIRVFYNDVYMVDIPDIFANNPRATAEQVIYELELNDKYTQWAHHKMADLFPQEYVVAKINELRPK